MKRTREKYGGRRILAVILLFLLFLPSWALAQESFRNMSAEELKKLIEGHARITILDNRSEDEFRLGHIPGALNIPPVSFHVIETLLPPDKGAFLIFYCRGFT